MREVRRFLRYLEELDRNCEKALRDGLGLDEALPRVFPSISKGWKMRRMAEAYVRGLWKKHST